MVKGLNYERAKSEVEYYKYLEPKLTIFEEFYDYLNSNEYYDIVVDEFSIHGKKVGETAQLLFDVSKYYEYALRVLDKYTIIFRYENGRYKLHRMNESIEFNNLHEIIKYFNSVSDINI